jgi:Family of unknown function (DUF6084)
VPDLKFQIEGAEAVPYSAVPLIALKLRITNQPPNEPIHTLALRYQVQIEPARRRYAPEEQNQLSDLFGEPERWGKTVRPLLWMNTSVSVPGFTGTTLVDLQLPCTFDFNVAATKYFHALAAGDIPLNVLFSGTAFYQDEHEFLQAIQIPWDREASYRLPIEIWKRMMDLHYPNSAWLSLRRDAFEKLHRYKVRHGIPTFERVIEALIPEEVSNEPLNRMPNKVQNKVQNKLPNEAGKGVTV